MYRIPFNKPHLAGRELLYIAQCVLDGHTSGDGAFTRRCEAWLEARVGEEARVLLTTSASSALDMAALLCEVGPGDEVILPSFAFVTCANAFALRGATPVFVDVQPGTLNVDPEAVAAAITPRTKAILALHYAGVGCAMERLSELAREHGIRLIEDAAHGVGARYRDRSLGAWGDLAVFSFHETKNVICGEGGALVVNDPELRARAEILREKGTDRARFFRGEVDRYTWQDLGSSWVPSEILAAFLWAQLEHCDAILARRRALWARYAEALAPLEQAGHLTLGRVPVECEASGHLFYVLLEDEPTRARLIAHLKARGILAVFHYVPLHSAPAGRRWGRAHGSLAVTERSSERLLRLPLYVDLSEAEQDEVIGEVRGFFGE